MELRHLRYFIVAAEEEHFHRAAERLGIVQPALSRQIRMLEDEIGVNLFERLSHGVRLSPAGRVYLEGAKKILEDVERLTARAQRAEKGHIGLLRIGFTAVGGRTRAVLQAINTFRREFPQVDLELNIARSQAQLDALMAGTLDLALGFDRPRDDPEFEHVFVQQNRCCLVLPAAHALAAAKHIRLTDLRNESFVLMPRYQQSMTYDHLIAACRAGGLTPRITQEVKDEQTILHLIAAGAGVSFLVGPVNGLLPEGVAVRDVDDLSVPLQLELVWRRGSTSAVLRHFVRIMRSALDQEQAPVQLQAAAVAHQ